MRVLRDDGAERQFSPEAVPIDHLISPEQLVTDNIYKLIASCRSISPKAKSAWCGGLGLLWLAALVGSAISSLNEHMPHIETRVAAIFRQDRQIRQQGSTIIEAGDEVFFMVASQHIRVVMS